MSSQLIAVITFVCAAIILYSIVQYVYAQREMSKRIRGLGDTDPQPAQTPAERSRPSDSMPTVTRMLSGSRFTENLMFSLIQAGIKLRPSEFLGIVAGITLVLLALTAVVLHSILAMLVALFAGIVLPGTYLRLLQQRRVQQFNKQLPDALSLMSSSLRTGYSFLRAMQMVANEMPNPIAEEFQRVINETNVGVPMDQALQHLTMRVKSYDLELVVTAVMIQQQIGGNLSEILENIAETIRERVRVEGEIAALTAEGKMSGIILVILPLGMAAILTVLNPNYMRTLVIEPLGRVMILSAVVLQILGGIVIKRMLALDF